MIKVEKPCEAKFCEECEYSRREHGNLFCTLPIVQAVSDKALICKNCKVCFAFKERETERRLSNEQ